MKLTREEILEIERKVGYVRPYHTTNTDNPIDFPAVSSNSTTEDAMTSLNATKVSRS